MRAPLAAVIVLSLAACSSNEDAGDLTADSGSPSSALDGGSVLDASSEDAAAGPCASCTPGLSCVTANGNMLCAPPPTPDVTDEGGPVLTSMRVWTVVWAGDESAGQTLDAFRHAFLTSSAWSERVAEYGVGAGSAEGVIVLSGSAPATVHYTDIEAVIPTLPGRTTIGGVTVPAPDDQTVYGFLIPEGSAEPDGYYHDETTDAVTTVDGGTINVPYIVDRQDTSIEAPPTEYLTWSDSHELVETATDPHADIAWTTAWMPDQGEVGDLCDDVISHEDIGGVSYALTRVYSATKAKARTGDPCVPALAGPYADVAVVPAQVVVPKGVGKSASFTLVPFTYGSPTPMSWGLYGDASYSFSPASGVSTPGETVNVVVTRISASPIGGATALYVWVNGPTTPNADPPSQEWIGGIAIGP